MMDNNDFGRRHDPGCLGGVACDCDDKIYSSGGTRNGVSTLGAILLTIFSFLITCFVIGILFSDVENVSAGVIMFLFIVITSIIGGIVGTVKK